MPAQGQFVHAPLTSFLPPKTDLRDRTAPEYLDRFHNEFCPDVAKRGIQVPVIGYREGDMIVVVDGWTRVLAGLIKQLKTAPCLLYDAPLSDGDAEIASFQANIKRADMAFVEKGRFYASTMAAKGWTQARLCKELSLDPSDVCRTLKPFEKLPSDLLERVGKDIPPRAAYALSGLASHDVMREFVEKLAKGLLCVESLEGHIKALKCKGNGATKAKPRKLKAGGVEIVVPGDMTDEQVTAVLAEVARKLKKAS